MFKKVSKDNGFTIVELLVVIVVIGILAAITIVSYTGITQKATKATLQSDISNATKQLEMAKISNGAYPTTNNCSTADSATNLCLKASGGSEFTYQVPDANSPMSFTLYEASNGNSQIMMKTNQSTINNVSKICPLNFVLVPGSTTYGTSDFCTMKYEARIQGIDDGYQGYNSSYIAESRPTGGAWIQINQTQAIAAAATACSGCRLITEAEWMTIAQNVASVASNWNSGTVGDGYLYSGMTNTPTYTFSASNNDDNGYYNVTDNPEYIQYNLEKRRTLTLTNGQIIWDFSGNMEEWTTGNTNGISDAIYYSEWPAVSESVINTITSQLTVNPSPAGTGITGASNWNNSNGTGKMTLYSGSNGVMRGGGGIFGYHSYNSESNGSQLGFRSTN